MNILNQKFDSDEDDEDYVPKEDKNAKEIEQIKENDALKELRHQKQAKEVDDIWAEMLAEENSNKRKKVSETQEKVITKTAKPEEKKKEEEKPRKTRKKEDDSLEDAAAQALAAIKAMKSKSNKNTIKEKVKFAGGSYEVERERTEQDSKREERIKKQQVNSSAGGLDALVTNIDNLDKKVN